MKNIISGGVVQNGYYYTYTREYDKDTDGYIDTYYTEITFIDYIDGPGSILTKKYCITSNGDRTEDSIYITITLLQAINEQARELGWNV